MAVYHFNFIVLVHGWQSSFFFVGQHLGVVPSVLASQAEVGVLASLTGGVVLVSLIHRVFELFYGQGVLLVDVAKDVDELALVAVVVLTLHAPASLRAGESDLVVIFRGPAECIQVSLPQGLVDSGTQHILGSALELRLSELWFLGGTSYVACSIVDFRPQLLS